MTSPGQAGQAEPDVDIVRFLPVPVTTVSVPVFAGDSRVTGWSFKETTGAAPAELWLIDGNDAGGNPFAFITLTANQSVRDVTNDAGLTVTTGLFVRVVSGSIQGAIWAVDT